MVNQENFQIIPNQQTSQNQKNLPFSIGELQGEAVEDMKSPSMNSPESFRESDLKGRLTGLKAPNQQYGFSPNPSPSPEINRMNPVQKYPMISPSSS